MGAVRVLGTSGGPGIAEVIPYQDHQMNPSLCLETLPISYLSTKYLPDKDALKWFSKKVNVHGHTDDMLPTTRRALEEFYAPHNKQLEELLIKLT